MNEVISIIIPVYNCESFICRCLDSVINQTYREIKIIIVDDGSTDSSLAICEEYKNKDKRIQIITQRNAGVSAARNQGMEFVNTKWLLFLDADDELPADALEIYQKIIMNNPNVDFIAGGAEKISSRRVEYVPFLPLPFCSENGKNYAVNVLYHLSYGTVWGKLFQSDLIKKQGLQFDEELTHGEDCIFVYQYLQFSHNPISIRERIYRYYVNELSVTKKFLGNIPQSYLNALAELKESINQNDTVELQAFYHSCLLHLLLITVNFSFHKSNPYSIFQKMRDYKQLILNPIFQTALAETRIKYIGMGERAVLFMIKIGFYPGVYLCARVRQALR